MMGSVPVVPVNDVAHASRPSGAYEYDAQRRKTSEVRESHGGGHRDHRDRDRDRERERERDSRRRSKTAAVPSKKDLD
jgi:hypothetical protein